MMEASPWWWSLRQQPQSQEVIRDLLRQMLSALALLQAANITHRYLCLPRTSNLIMTPAKDRARTHKQYLTAFQDMCFIHLGSFRTGFGQCNELYTTVYIRP